MVFFKTELYSRMTCWIYLNLVLFISFYSAESTTSGQECFERDETDLELGRTCKKSCESADDCKNVLKQCLCDDICGMSCVNPELVCPELESPDYGRIHGNRTYGSEVTYTCNDGYVLVGSSTRRCRSDKKWSGSAPYCEVVGRTSRPDCPQRNENKIEVGRNCKKSCETDENCRNPSKQCLCDDICGMSCINIEWVCPELDTPDYGRIHGNRTYGSEVTYTCNDGYVLVGSSSRRCRSDKTWTGSAPTCEAIFSCSNPSRISRAFPETRKSVFLIGDVVTYECNYGHIFSGNPNVTCTRQGWTTNLIQCTRVECGPPPNITNGYWEGNDFHFGGRATYHCHVGYELSTRRNFVSCATNGRWREDVPSCEVKTCQAPLSPVHGEVRDFGVDYSYGNEINYTCNPGFMLKGSDVGRCNENDTWGKVPECVVDLYCGFETFLKPTCGFETWGKKFNRSITDHSIDGREGHVAKVSFVRSQTKVLATLFSPRISSRNNEVCLRFYYRVSHFETGSEFHVTTDEANPLWSYNPRIEPQNEWLGADYSFPASHDDYEVWFVVKGYLSWTTVELDNITLSEDLSCYDECNPNPCQNGGTCINRINDYTCACSSLYEGRDCTERIDCTVPPVPSFGSVKPMPGSRVVLGGTITYSCNPGYVVSNQKTRSLTATCGRDRRWSRPGPVCRDKLCVVPPTPAQSTASRNPATRVIPDQSVSFSCKEGYRMIGQPTVFCSRDGTWSNTFPECVARRCTPTGECHFPFDYGGNSHKSCIYSNIHGYWCSLTAVYRGRWAKCTQTCPVGWSSWSLWSSCSEGCAEGQQTRTRRCQNPPGGARCEGKDFERKECNIQTCLNDGGVRHETKIYKMYTIASNYDEASTKCAQLPGRLAMLRTKEIFDKVIKRMPRKEIYYIGMRVRGETWTYSDGSRVPLRGEQGYQRWGQRQPDNWQRSEKCGSLWTKQRPNRAFWNDINCARRHHFICEIDINPCRSNPCENGGYCRKTATSFNCECAAQYTGPTCNQVAPRCNVLSPPLNGSMIAMGGAESSALPGSSTRFQCDEGFLLEGESVLECLSNLEWSDTVPRCCRNQ
ncbi:sushi, von Willebrand factor type A, EGF and pentraxin domain-containing protein 1-like isoform X2 [Clavelina lepadiformis]|uniref:sushi, von Willebrand factor type A, EGF and pentraxin domain-containing protein 1-like isoform X2 n=1 Tax=Clavelina lepadiformis TaxID=159417 RepID=UPI004041BC4C